MLCEERWIRHTARVRSQLPSFIARDDVEMQVKDRLPCSRLVELRDPQAIRLKCLADTVCDILRRLDEFR